VGHRRSSLVRLLRVFAMMMSVVVSREPGNENMGEGRSKIDAPQSRPLIVVTPTLPPRRLQNALLFSVRVHERQLEERLKSTRAEFDEKCTRYIANGLGSP